MHSSCRDSSNSECFSIVVFATSPTFSETMVLRSDQQIVTVLLKNKDMRKHIFSDTSERSQSTRQQIITTLETELTALQEKNRVIELRK